MPQHFNEIRHVAGFGIVGRRPDVQRVSLGPCSRVTAVDEPAVACISASLRRWTVAVAVRGDALGRVTLALRNQELLSAPAPANPARVRLTRTAES